MSSELHFVYVVQPVDLTADGLTAIIDNTNLNGNPDASFVVTPWWNPVGLYGARTGALLRRDRKLVGAHYIAAQERWGIAHLDNTPMMPGSAFSIGIQLIDPTLSNAPGYIHYAADWNTAPGAYNTVIDLPAINRDPTAVLVVTPRVNSYVRYPLGVLRPNVNHALGVWWNPARERWNIFNQDSAPIALGASYNISIQSEASSGYFNLHARVVVAPVGGADRLIFGLDRDEGREGMGGVFATHIGSVRNIPRTYLYDPTNAAGLFPGPIFNHPIAVEWNYSANHLALVCMDGARFPEGAAFCVYAGA